MQPAQAEGGGSSSNNVKKWGPIGAIVIVVAAIVGFVVVSGGDDDEASTDSTTPATEPASTEAPTETTGDTALRWHRGAGGWRRDRLSRCRSARRRSRASRSPGTNAATPNAAPSPSSSSSLRSVTPRSRATTAAPPPAASPRTSIKVVLYQGPDDDPIINYLSDAVNVDDTNAESEQTARDMLEMYDQFYEFYGRSIELETYVSTGLANDEVTARADAVRIAEDFEPFVVLGGPALTSAFADELAAREVMCIGCTPGQPPEWYAERDPYVWGVGIGG